MKNRWGSPIQQTRNEAMWRYVNFKKVLPSMLLVAVIIAIGVTMITTLRSQDRKEQAAWNQVLREDQDTAARAREALSLVDKLEAAEKQYPQGSAEVKLLQEKILEVWPDFTRAGPNGTLGIPSFKSMRRQLKFYISRA
jgi:hypothetical protein